MLLGWGFLSLLPSIIPRTLIKFILGVFLPYLRRELITIIPSLSILFHSEVELSTLKSALKNAMSAFPLLRARYQGDFFQEEIAVLSHEKVVVPFEVVRAQDFDAQRRAAVRRISYGHSSLVEFLYDKDNYKLIIICDHTICDYGALLVILAKHIVLGCNGDNFIFPERRAFSDFSKWQHSLNQNYLNSIERKSIIPGKGSSFEGEEI